MNSHLSSSLDKIPPMEASSNYDYFCPLSCFLVEGTPHISWNTRGRFLHLQESLSLCFQQIPSPKNHQERDFLARNVQDGRLEWGSLQRDVVTLVGRTQRTLHHGPGELSALSAASLTFFSTCLS